MKQKLYFINIIDLISGENYNRKVKYKRKTITNTNI